MYISRDRALGKEEMDHRIRRTGYVFDVEMLLHHNPFPSDHPEQPTRVQAIHDRLSSQGLLQSSIKIPSRPATIQELCSFHSPSYLQTINSLKEMGEEDLMVVGKQYDSIYLCGETPVSAGLAAGSTIALATAIANGTVGNGFAIVRPPGHHAEHNQVCILLLLCINLL